MGNLLGSPVTDKETHTGETTASPSSSSSGHASLKWGMSSMQGWRVHMEDAHICEGNLYALQQEGGDTTKKLYLPGHSLFAVFDGHGGTFSAMYAGRNFLRVLSKQPKFVEYARMVLQQEEEEEKNSTTASTKTMTRPARMALLEQALQQAFVETDYEIALAIRGRPHPHANQEYHPIQLSAIGGGGDTGDAHMSDGTSPTAASNAAFSMRDAASRAAADHVSALDDDGDSGTTACMVMITPDVFVCANAGDSRAVFSRRSTIENAPHHQQRQAVPLSYDHKPDDEPEERRIRAAGGYVAGGRVEGDLAVSRGLGDFRFKSMPVVLNNTQLFKDTSSCTSTTMDHDDDNEEDDPSLSPEPIAFPPGDQKVSPIPDILVHSRNNELDEYVIVACDGIWDVRTNQECVMEVAAMVQEGETDMGLICEEVCTIRNEHCSFTEGSFSFFLCGYFTDVGFFLGLASGYVFAIGFKRQHDGHCRTTARII
jgi:serine/threonine protein phosphatase PrpC